MRNIYFDIESTGLSVYKDKIVQISFIIEDTDKGESENKMKTFLLNPGIDICEGAYRVHGISNDNVKGCITFDKIAKSVVDAFNFCDNVITYNGEFFDMPMLAMELMRCGLILPDINHIDVYKLVQQHEISKKLSSVYVRYFGENLVNSHSADADNLATKRIYNFLQKNKGIE